MGRTIDLQLGESLTLPDGTVVRAVASVLQWPRLEREGVHPVERAAEILGSQNDLAAALNVSKGAVSQWKDEGRRVPAKHCPSIERLTRGVVSCEDLRPDVDWAYLRSIPAAKSAQGA